MIPPFDDRTGYLPAGEHRAEWHEVAERFGWNDHRRQLLRGLHRLTSALRDLGCRLFLLDGSFVTEKDMPSDFDACCDYSGIPPKDLYRLRLMDSKEVMKAEWSGEIYPFQEHVPSDCRYTFRAFFQSDRDDMPKGVVSLDLGSVP